MKKTWKHLYLLAVLCTAAAPLLAEDIVAPTAPTTEETSAEPEETKQILFPQAPPEHLLETIDPNWQIEIQPVPINILPEASKVPPPPTGEQALRHYNSGALRNPTVLPLEGPGFVKIFRPRGRVFGTQEIVDLIESLATKMQELFPSKDRLQIGDIAAEHGGKLKEHESHQNGLDVDIAFIRKNQTEQDPAVKVHWTEYLVYKNKITKNFDVERNWAFAKLLVGSGKVQRILVNPAVKSAFCQQARALGELESAKETLWRVRPEEGHMEHFHIRLFCPTGSQECRPQEEPAPGIGC